MPCCPATPPTTATARVAATEPLTAPKVHLHLQVGDLARSVDFYRALFGAEPVKLLPGYAKFLPAWGPVNLPCRRATPCRPAARSATWASS